jgi:hypothetical protein
MSDFRIRQQEILEKTTWARRIALGAALLAVLLFARWSHADEMDLPREQPLTATGFVYCNAGQKLIVGVVITYPSGKVVRFSKDHMHGLTLPDLVKYADSIEDSAIYGAGACDSVAT